MRAMRKVGWSVVGLLVLGAVTVPAWAEVTPPQVAVRYGDLDLSTRKGAETLYARIVTAAQKVCPLPISNELIWSVATVNCRHAAVQRAVNSIQSPRLSEIFAARTRYWHQTPA